MKRWFAFAVVIILAVLLFIFIIGISSKAEKKYTAIYDLPQKNPPQLIAKFFANFNFALAPQSKQAMEECFYPHPQIRKEFEIQYNKIVEKVDFKKFRPFLFHQVINENVGYSYSDGIQFIQCQLFFIPKTEEDIQFLSQPQVYIFKISKGPDGNWYFIDISPLTIKFPPSYYYF